MPKRKGTGVKRGVQQLRGPVCGLRGRQAALAVTQKFVLQRVFGEGHLRITGHGCDDVLMSGAIAAVDQHPRSALLLLSPRGIDLHLHFGFQRTPRPLDTGLQK